MYTGYICKDKINENTYDTRFPISKLNEAINYYNLNVKSNIKEYWDNNVIIIFGENNNSSFHYIKDINISYDSNKQILIQEYIKNKCISYQFSNVHSEETYKLYENTNEYINIKLKKYNDYFTIEITSEDLKNVKNINNFYI
tara:strand:- start:2444 stop:2869 length:426 start_codon:yes stop_codon:yes gene_type:complete